MFKLRLATLLFIFGFVSAYAYQEDTRLVWKKGTDQDGIPQEIIEFYKQNSKLYQVEEYKLELPIYSQYALAGDVDLVIQGYTGGAHCCSWVKVFKTEPDFRQVASMEIAGPPPLWTDIDEDGEKELITSDYTFDYWHTSHATSALPEVILKFDGKQFMANANLMRTNDVTSEEVLKMAKEIKEDEGYWEDNYFDDPPAFKLPIAAAGAITSQVLELLYTGQHDLAQLFIDNVWPEDNPHKQLYINELDTELNKSPFWQDLKRQGFKSVV